MVRAAPGENRRVKCVSFQRQSERFANEVAANLGVPWVVALAAEGRMVEEAVSMEFAVRYVPVYRLYVFVRIYVVKVDKESYEDERKRLGEDE